MSGQMPANEIKIFYFENQEMVVISCYSIRNLISLGKNH